ncbi:hypothetical protein FOXYSP1_11123 [Fusarium oxysporum f. sp. phaseoli]
MMRHQILCTFWLVCTYLDSAIYNKRTTKVPPIKPILVEKGVAQPLTDRTRQSPIAETSQGFSIYGCSPVIPRTRGQLLRHDFVTQADGFIIWNHKPQLMTYSAVKTTL